jgi:mannan endo-1,4-beta-mannosidase
MQSVLSRIGSLRSWAAGIAVIGASLSSGQAGAGHVSRQNRDFVEASGQQLTVGGQPYRFVGANYWYGINLGSAGPGGDRPRLLRELDQMQAHGITNLRIMAGSEGPTTEPYRMLPPLQIAPGQYDPQVFEGLDFLLAEMRRRGMRAIMCLSNFWHWSGGMAQYVAWSQGTTWIPYPPERADWDTYQRFVARFYVDPKAKGMYSDFVRTVTSRVNVINGLAYRDDPTIFAWELANEPRGIDHPEEFVSWVTETAALLKRQAPRQLVTVGSEGTTPYPGVHTLAERVHAVDDVDFMTFHTWVQNWGHFDPAQPASFEDGLDFALRYNAEQIAIAKRLGKPVVFEEFGLARDGGSFDPSSPTTMRDRYFDALLTQAFDRRAHEGIVSGVSFWAYSGEGRPRSPGGTWTLGHPFIGDPPHEPQGWYSVYDTDQSTLAIIKRHAGSSRLRNRAKSE